MTVLWGQLPANADLSEILPPLVVPIIVPIVEPMIPSDYCTNNDPRLHGSHSLSDISGLVTALSEKQPLSEKGAVNGYAGLDAQGKVPAAQLPAAGGGLWTRVVLSADRTNNNAVANTLADVTGLSFPVVAGQRYWFKFRIIYTAQATTTGSRWSINGPAVTGLVYMSEYSLTTTTTTKNPTLTGFNLPAASNASSALTGPSNYAEIEGFIQPSANGNVIARFASEVANSAIIAKVGSFVEYTQV